MDIRAAGLDTDLANHGKGGVAHELILAVGERLHRRNGDGVAGVHAHRIEVLDRTNDHAVVHSVAHHFHLEFLPADERFLDQHFGHRRQIETARGDVVQFVAIVCDAAAHPAEAEGRTNDERKRADFIGDAVRIAE